MQCSVLHCRAVQSVVVQCSVLQCDAVKCHERFFHQTATTAVVDCYRLKRRSASSCCVFTVTRMVVSDQMPCSSFCRLLSSLKASATSLARFSVCPPTFPSPRSPNWQKLKRLHATDSKLCSSSAVSQTLSASTACRWATDAERGAARRTLDARGATGSCTRKLQLFKSVVGCHLRVHKYPKVGTVIFSFFSPPRAVDSSSVTGCYHR